ncbi:histidine phosphatase family protein [Brevibacterium daeguense]|uniref:Histidine phosphatase family protein n=1 Tax=Brevibacterium daeguense TaxID=909936 RepID=A0ABP8ENH3_9MICO|nr:histidine phosphatase family protein [Brevibacterium daeguense]
MPFLVLARHAKAARPPVADFDRPLTEEGFAEARAAGEFLTRYPLEHFYSSAALRTVQTGQGVVDAFAAAGTQVELHTDRALYDSDVDDWLEVIANIPADSTGAYIVGHEPIVSQVIGVLSPEFGVPAKFRPSSVAVFELTSWGLEVGRFPTPEISCFR